MKEKLQALALAAGLWFNAMLAEAGLSSAANEYSRKTYDHELLLKAAGLLAATTVGAIILDIGPGLVDCDLVLDVSAIEVATGDEIYTVYVEGSNVEAMTSGSVILATAQLGNVAAPSDADTATGRFIFPFRNELNGTIYRYVRLHTAIAGTIATGINFTAFLAKK